MNWNDLITVPGIIFLIPIVAIICGSVTALAKMCFQHRERIALIEQGLHPDYPPEDDLDENRDSTKWTRSAATVPPNSTTMASLKSNSASILATKPS